jgi:hypothetical protein
MFLKALKQKSNQKYLETLLSHRQPNVHADKVKSVAVLLNADEYIDFESFRTFFKQLGLTSPKHKVVAFTSDDKTQGSKWESYFSPKDFGWKDKINHTDLQLFVEEDFDILISYYKEDILYLNMITAMSKANLKVGLSSKDSRLYDLIIDVQPKNFKTFKSEFKKYLTILNKL